MCEVNKSCQMLKYIEFSIWVIKVNEEILLICFKIKCIKLFENQNILVSKWMLFFFLFKYWKKKLLK